VSGSARTAFRVARDELRALRCEYDRAVDSFHWPDVRGTRNCLSAKSGLSLLHQLSMSAQKRWRRLRGFRQLADIIAGVKFIDGVDERKISRKAA
jgi:hypothetical protein